MRARLLLLCSLLWVGAWAGEEPEAEPLPPPVVAPLPPEQPQAAVTTGQGPAVEVADEFAPYEAKYEVRYAGLKVGEMTQQLTARMDGRQTLQTVAYTTGLASWLKNDTVTERSIWRDEAGVLLPLSYTYRYTGRSNEAFERLDFDWQAGTIKSLRDGKVTELALERGTLDKHMHQLVLRHDLAGGGRHFSYPVADRSKLKEYRYEVVGEERLQNELLGPLDCLKVQKGTTTIWVARQLDYLPVKVEKDENGSLVSSELTEYQGR